jgi:hypothetical protein
VSETAKLFAAGLEKLSGMKQSRINIELRSEMLEPWQIFRVAKNRLPKSALKRIFGQRADSIEDWSSDPRYSYDIYKNPIQEMIQFLLELKRCGLNEYAREVIEIIWRKYK